MKLRKSLVKPVMRQNISSSLVLPLEIVMHDALVLFSERPLIYVSSCMTISGGRIEQHVVIGFGELAAVDYNT